MAAFPDHAAEYPKLRAIDIRPHQHNGQTYFLLRDPLHLSEDVLLLPQPMAAVLAYCDGNHSPRAAAAAMSRRFGVDVPDAFVNQVVAALDDAYLLDNSRAAAALLAARDAFRQAPFRPPLLAGQGYPADPDALHDLLEGYLEQARRRRTEAGLTTPALGLLSPHIDYPRGGHVYAEVWDRAGAAAAAADLVVIFGTDHYGADLVTLTRQNYATPYGVLPTAVEIVDRLAAALGEEAAYAGELRHRAEHSLELVTVWLHHMRGRRPIEVVPILVGGLHGYFYNGGDPSTDPTLQRVLATLRQATAGRRVLVVASGDLAHVGPAFGGAPLDAAARAAVAQADQGLIAHMRRGDAAGFFEAIRGVRDRNNVCGVTPIYLTLRLLGDVTGEPLGYASCRADDHATSAVTIGGMLFRPA